MSRYINDYTVVIQEYFQVRVRTWLETVGKDIFGIDHYWLRFEFAPGRGQVHAHMIATTNKMEDMSALVYKIRSGAHACPSGCTKDEFAASVLAQWAEQTLGLTAKVIPSPHSIDQTDQAPQHPSSRNFSEVHNNLADDANAFLYTCQEHVCTDYCLRKRRIFTRTETSKSKQRRECHAGCGVEKTHGKGDTPGFVLRKKTSLEKYARGFLKLQLPHDNKRKRDGKKRNPIQTSLWLAHGWRANCDLQLILYDGNPREPDPAEVARITDYIVAYASKGIESFTQEQDQVKELVMASTESSGDTRDVVRLTRQILNRSLSQKVLSKQEAMVHILKLDLYLCSQSFERISLSNYHRLGATPQSSRSGKAFLTTYARRPSHQHHLSLHQFFHQTWSPGAVPFYTAAMTKPKCPPSEEYSKYILLVHRPWVAKFLITKDNGQPVNFVVEFRIFRTSKLCPKSVKVQYERAKY